MTSIPADILRRRVVEGQPSQTAMSGSHPSSRRRTGSASWHIVAAARRRASGPQRMCSTISGTALSVGPRAGSHHMNGPGSTNTSTRSVETLTLRVWARRIMMHDLGKHRRLRNLRFVTVEMKDGENGSRLEWATEAWLQLRELGPPYKTGGKTYDLPENYSCLCLAADHGECRLSVALWPRKCSSFVWRVSLNDGGLLRSGTDQVWRTSSKTRSDRGG